MSEQSLDNARCPFKNALHPRALTKTNERDLLRMIQVIEEHGVHLLPDVLIQNHQRGLIVEGQRPIVEVDRPDGAQTPSATNVLA